MHRDSKSKEENNKEFFQALFCGWGGGGNSWFWKTILCCIELYWRGGAYVLLSYFFNSLCASMKIKRKRKREGVR
jgi:hypothetical protein